MKFKTGWLPDVPDIRDWLYNETFQVAAQLAVPIRKWWPPWNWCGTKLEDVDLRGGLPPVFDQGELGSCVENAWAAAMAFLEGKEGNSQEVLSRLFIYWNVRDGKPEDSGSSIRAGIKAVASYGAPLEPLWPYDMLRWKTQPSPEAFAEAKHRSDVQYARLETLEDMQHCLMAGYPFVFGMSIYGSFETLQGKDCVLPMPGITSKYLGGHAQCAVGMSSKRQAFLIRNSWGDAWGDGGYYWLPWDYAASPMLADDFWTVRRISK